MKWFIAAMLLLIAAIAFRLGLLAYATYALLGTLLVSRWLAHAWIGSLEADRQCNTLSADIGQTVAVIVTVRNRGRLPIAWVLLEDLLPRRALAARPPDLAVEGERTRLTMLRAGQTISLLYQVTPRRRGYYQLGPLIIETGDLFGLHRRWRVATEPHFLLVCPRVLPLEGYDIESRRPIGEVQMAYRFLDDPTRMAGTRRYEPGDPLNRVHWRATARTGYLHSKIYEPSTVAGATLVLEFHRDSYDPRHEPIVSDLLVTAAASIANALYEMGRQVGLVSNGCDAADRIRIEGWEGDIRSRDVARSSAAMRDESDRMRPLVVETRRGETQLRQILRALARVELGHGLPFMQLLSEADCHMPRDATALVLLPDVTPEVTVALGALRRRGYAVTAILALADRLRYADASAALLGEGVAAVPLVDEASIPAICRAAASHGGHVPAVVSEL